MVALTFKNGPNDIATAPLLDVHLRAGGYTFGRSNGRLPSGLEERT